MGGDSIYVFSLNAKSIVLHMRGCAITCCGEKIEIAVVRVDMLLEETSSSAVTGDVFFFSREVAYCIIVRTAVVEGSPRHMFFASILSIYSGVVRARSEGGWKDVALRLSP